MALRKLNGKVEVPVWLALLWTVLPLAVAGVIGYVLADRDTVSGDQVAAMAKDAAADADRSWLPDQSPQTARQALESALDHHAQRLGLRAPLVASMTADTSGGTRDNGASLLVFWLTVTGPDEKHPVCVAMAQTEQQAAGGPNRFTSKTERGACPEPS